MVTPAQAREIIHEWMFASKPAIETGAKAVDALRDLASQVESLQADAERYREIRSSRSACASLCGFYEPEKLDAAIDEARKQS